jgi:hypothetical protein
LHCVGGPARAQRFLNAGKPLDDAARAGGLLEKKGKKEENDDHEGENSAELCRLFSLLYGSHR